MIRKKIKFKELYLENSKNGVYKSSEFHGTGIKIVNMGELFKFDLIKNQDMKLIELTDEEKDKNCLRNGDLLFARRSVVADGAGKCSYIECGNEEMTFESSIIRVRLNNVICNSKYYYYYFKSPIGKGKILSIASGVSVKGIKGSDLKELEVDYLDINSQNKIVKILSSYDDLIENNLKRINLLEESIELIYKEWFVNLRFPGYEKYNIVNGIPEGWNTKLVKEFGEVITGKTPPTKISEYYDGDIPFIKTPDMNDVYIIKTNQSLTEEGAKSQISKYVPKNTILVSCIGTVGVVSLTSELSQFNQQINGLIPKEEYYLHYMYFKFKSLKEYLEALGSSGATMLNVNKGKFENIEILEPSKEVLYNFMNICKPVFDNILNLQYQNEKLKEARDILIPRLISGEIEV